MFSVPRLLGIKILLFVVFFSVAGLLRAQNAAEPVAWVESFVGKVLVRQNDKTVSASDELALQTGDIVATQADANAVIRFENDCKLRLPEQQALDIRAAMACCDENISEGAIAELGRVNGDVSVYRGSAPQKGVDGFELFVADIVQTGADSTTFIIYPDGCGVKLDENKQHTLMFARECCIQGCLLPIAAVVPTLFGTTAVTAATAGTAAAAAGAVIAADDDNNNNEPPPLSLE